MKRIISVLTVLTIMLIPLYVFGIAEKSYNFFIGKEDLSGKNFQIFLQNCKGHYDSGKDIALVYVTNTSNRKANFQLHVGYSGSTEKPTSIDSAVFEILPGKSAQLSVAGLKKAYEKANDQVGYVPGKTLSESSVVRISVTGLGENDTFSVTGISVGSVKNTYFKETKNFSEASYDSSIIASAENVGAKPATPEPEPFGVTLNQPSQKFVNTFIAFIGASAVLCAGGIVIYIVSAIIKRRKTND